MDCTRREFGRLALASLPAAAWLDRPLPARGWLQTRPNSLVAGVQLGAITYSYLSMPDQSMSAILKYVVDSGISAIELMGSPAERFAGGPGRGGAADVSRAWRLSAPMAPFRQIRKMFREVARCLQFCREGLA